MKVIPPTAQLFVALGVTAFVWLIAAKMTAEPTQKDLASGRQTVWIMRGIQDARMLFQNALSTAMPILPGSIDLPRSVNKYGGAQYCYSFWLKANDCTPQNVANVVLFCRGGERDPGTGALKQYALQKYDLKNGNSPLHSASYTTPLIKAPLFAFGESYRSFVLEFNTSENVEQRFVSEDAWTGPAKAAVDAIPGRWTMFTIVVEDNLPPAMFEDRIRYRLYINDVLVTTATAPGALISNDGDLHIFPNLKPLANALVADLKYMPWAPSDEEIVRMFQRGVSAVKTCAAPLPGALLRS